MRDFIVTSTKFSGGLKFGYNNDGVLMKFENQANLTPEQLSYFTKNFPFFETDLQKIITKNGKLTEITDLSFNRFWELYNYKKGKINAEKEWAKLNDSDKTLAIMSVHKYKLSLKGKNIDMVFAERYLKYKRFDDEY